MYIQQYKKNPKRAREFITLIRIFQWKTSYKKDTQSIHSRESFIRLYFFGIFSVCKQCKFLEIYFDNFICENIMDIIRKLRRMKKEFKNKNEF